MKMGFKIGIIVLAVVVLATLWGVLVVQGDNSGIRLSTKVMGQNQWLSGSRASLRIITANQITDQPVAGASVQISLAKKDSGRWVRLFSGNTNVRGTADVAFDVPSEAVGDYTLKVVAQAIGEKDEIESQVKIKRENRVMLTTDKPLYQPGQLIHIRALALSIPKLTPAAGRECVIEVDDAKGNKVFKKREKLSRFGVMGADFQLANEINKGSYTIRALVDNDRVEKKVTVDRYVLPKFKVTLQTDKKYYLPGQKVKGTIHADYFFGKPVAKGKVVVKLAKFDVGFNDFAEVNGTTNDAGVFEFEQELPTSFVGQPLEQGNAFFKAEVAVTDGADHTEKATTQVPVAKDALKILAVPESGRFVPGVENTLYIVVSYPDGTPAKAVVRARDPLPNVMADVPLTGNYRTNDLGITEIAVTPSDTAKILRIMAEADGNTVMQDVPLDSTGQEEGLILRLDKAVATVGDDLELTVLSSKPSGYVYVDIIKDNQTMLTRSLQFKNGRGEAVVPLTSDLFGTLNVHAYRISRIGNIIRDTRTVVVNQANDLKIAVSADKKSYLPGQPAKISFDVTDRRGRGLAAALGVSIVDESVFALQEMQPGLEKVYFMLEKELMEPKYEIHGITPKEIVCFPDGDSPKPVPLDAEKQQAAKVLFAAVRKEQMEKAQPMFTLNADSYAKKIEKVREQLSERIQADYKKIAEAIKKYYQDNPNAKLDQLGGVHYLVNKGMLPWSILKDQWGMPYDFKTSRWAGDYRYWFAVISSGPDRRKNTVDDLAVSGRPEWEREGQVFFGMDVDKDGDFFALDRRERGEWLFEEQVMEKGAPMPLMAAAPAGALRMAADSDFKFKVTYGDKKDAGGAPEVRIRQYFPETLYFNPAVITDDRGKGSISFDVADSITSWRLTAMGSSLNGLLGSTTSQMKVFQDFFIDIDLPVALTQNDEVSIPIAVYNYLPGSQKVKLVLSTEPWFELDGAKEKTLDVGSGDVKGVSYRIKVKEIGWHTLTVHAYGSKMNDAIKRQIEVLPDGQEVADSVNDRLEKSVTKKINIPADAIDGASNILVKVYPGYLSQVIEGMEKILQMPFGCFEQTSSTTYPNVLVLDYMRSTNQSTPEIQMKAEQYINLGYQRLLSFEVQGGGFEWFGNPPANKVLTAYGLLEFSDMAKVYEVDPNLISRTQQWLVSKQNEDGSWTPDKGGIAEGAINRQTDDFRTTAYILWALAESKADGTAVNKAVAYLQKTVGTVKDPYALGLAVNALVATESGKKTAEEVANRLDQMAKKTQDGGVYWESEGETPTFGSGKSATLETTGLVTLGLIKVGGHADTINGALGYIIKEKDPNGTWYSTQATILCFKALLASMNNRTQDINAKVTVVVNGKEAGSFNIDKDNSDVLRQVDCKEYVKEGENTVEIRFDGKGSSLYQISSKYFLPWDKVPGGKKKLMSIDVKYDRTQLEKDDIVTSNVNVAFNGNSTANMVIVDLGIPPGFDLLAEDLEKLVQDKKIMRYSLTGRQAIIYLDKVENGKPLAFSYRLRAKFPIKAKTPKSTAYLYYNPQERDVSPPVEIVVK